MILTEAMYFEYQNHENTLKQGIYSIVDIRNTPYTRFYKEGQVSSSTDSSGRKTSLINSNPRPTAQKASL